MNIQVVKPVLSAHQGGIMLDVKLGTKPLRMELDTGASVTIVSDKTWREELGGGGSVEVRSPIEDLHRTEFESLGREECACRVWRPSEDTASLCG